MIGSPARTSALPTDAESDAELATRRAFFSRPPRGGAALARSAWQLGQSLEGLVREVEAPLTQ